MNKNPAYTFSEDPPQQTCQPFNFSPVQEPDWTYSCPKGHVSEWYYAVDTNSCKSGHCIECFAEWMRENIPIVTGRKKESE